MYVNNWLTRRAMLSPDKVAVIDFDGENVHEVTYAALDALADGVLFTRKLAETKRQYSQLISAMKRAERKMNPVLTAFNDQVLFLKHNLEF